MFPKLHLSNFITKHTNVEIHKDEVYIKKIDHLNQFDIDSYVLFQDTHFHNGCIEVDVCGSLSDDAPNFARGFIGIVFRASDDQFDSFYIRPANGKQCHDPIRKKHGCQYFAYPKYTFQYFRNLNIDTYESEVNTIALNQYSHIKAIIKDKKAQFYVDGNLVLQIDSCLSKNQWGKVGIFVDTGTDGKFKNLHIESFD